MPEQADLAGLRHRLPRLPAISLAVAATLWACSQQHAPVGAGQSAAPPSLGLAAPQRAAPASPPDVIHCATVSLKTPDVAPLLASPITTMGPLAGDPQTCEFATAGFASVTVSVRPAAGPATLDAWESGKMALPVTSLPGVGERAVWQDTLHEAIATRAGLLCDVTVRANPEDLTAPAGQLPATAGALCNRVFAASLRTAALH